MKLFKSFVSVIVFISFLFLTGCSFFEKDPVDDAEAIVDDAMMDLSSFKSGKYDISIKADLDLLTSDESDFSFDFKAAGVFDVTDTKVPLFSLKLAGDIFSGEKVSNTDLELRLNEKDLYVFLTSLPVGGLVPDEMISQFAGQWWQLPIPPGSFDDLNLAREESSMTDEQKMLADVFESADFTVGTKFVAEENIREIPSYHYVTKLDNDSLKKFLDAAIKAQPNVYPLSESELADLDVFLKELVIDADIWVRKDNLSVRQISGVITSTSVLGGSSNIDFSLFFDNLGGQVVIDAPKDAQLFDPASVFGSFTLPPETDKNL